MKVEKIISISTETKIKVPLKDSESNKTRHLSNIKIKEHM